MKMGKSARQLGEKCGLSAQEMNYALKEAGLLDGEPGERFVTEKGKAFATEKDYHRGPGGYPSYNVDWTEISWDSAVKNQLDLSPKHKQEIREAVKEERRLRREAKAEASRLYWEAVEQKSDPQNENCTKPSSDIDKWIEIGGILVGVVGGVILIIPKAKVFWREKVKPTYQKVVAKFGKKAKDASSDEDSIPDSEPTQSKVE